MESIRFSILYDNKMVNLNREEFAALKYNKLNEVSVLFSGMKIKVNFDEKVMKSKCLKIFE